MTWHETRFSSHLSGHRPQAFASSGLVGRITVAVYVQPLRHRIGQIPERWNVGRTRSVRTRSRL